MSLHAQIHQHLLAAVGAIDAAGDFTFTVGKVLDHLPTPSQLAPLPVVAVVTGEVRGRQLPCDVVEKNATFSVYGWIDVPYQTSGRERADLWERDVEKALMSDRTRGGVAVDTMPGALRFYETDRHGIARFVLQVSVVYHEGSL